MALPWEELLALRVTTLRRLAGIAEASEVHRAGIRRGARGNAASVPG